MDYGDKLIDIRDVVSPVNSISSMLMGGGYPSVQQAVVPNAGTTFSPEAIGMSLENGGYSPNLSLPRQIQSPTQPPYGNEFSPDSMIKAPVEQPVTAAPQTAAPESQNVGMEQKLNEAISELANIDDGSLEAADEMVKRFDSVMTKYFGSDENLTKFWMGNTGRQREFER